MTERDAHGKFVKRVNDPFVEMVDEKMLQLSCAARDAMDSALTKAEALSKGPIE